MVGRLRYDLGWRVVKCGDYSDHDGDEKRKREAEERRRRAEEEQRRKAEEKKRRKAEEDARRARAAIEKAQSEVAQAEARWNSALREYNTAEGEMKQSDQTYQRAQMDYEHVNCAASETAEYANMILKGIQKFVNSKDLEFQYPYANIQVETRDVAEFLPHASQQLVQAMQAASEHADAARQAAAKAQASHSKMTSWPKRMESLKDEVDDAQCALAAMKDILRLALGNYAGDPDESA